MGLCNSSLPPVDEAQQKLDKKINQQINNDRKDDRVVHKLLLLGAGESGKSTLFKQMINIYGPGFDEQTRMQYRPRIFENIITAMRTLCRECVNYGPVAASLNEIREYVLRCTGEEDLSDAAMASYIDALWRDEGILKTWAKRASFQIPDSAAYFFNELKRICDPKYVPNQQDVLRVRIRTTGIVENEFEVEHNRFKMYDVGGQRTERKKWIHCFENVTAVIFVAALSEYDQMLFEDETQNRMKEALNLFEVICNSRWFKNTSMILFLNKRDLFEDKIKKVSLQVCFPDYSGSDEWKEAATYIDQQFRQRNHTTKDIYTHVTCATDTNNVEHVFRSVRETVIKQSLAEAEIL